jgi:hypothetical protein
VKVFFVIAKMLGIKGRPASIGALAICGLSVISFTALGYLGGELVFGASDLKKVEITNEEQFNPVLFNNYCSGCHPRGGNKYKPHFSLIYAPQLENFEIFLAYIRAPKPRDGSPAKMMQFSPNILSEQEARKIYQYIIEVLRKG